MERPVLFLTGGLFLALLPLAQLPIRAHEMPPVEQPDRAMMGMMAQIERLRERIEAAKRSNDPQAMRSALDEVEQMLAMMRGKMRASPGPATPAPSPAPGHQEHH